MLTVIRASDAIDVAFSPQAVWPVLVDVRKYSEWWPASLRLRVTSEGTGALGTEVEIRPPAGRAFRCRVEELQEPQWIRMRYEGGFVQGSGIWRLQPLETGSRVTYELDVTARGWLVALFARFIDVPGIHSRQMREVLRGLERILRARHGVKA